MQEEENNVNGETKAVEEKNEPAKTPPPFIGLEKKDEIPVREEEAGLRTLLEKNLKWSQIIYEQNRRISRRMLWTSIAAWLKWLLLLAVLVWTAWFVWPMLRALPAQYEAVTKQLLPGQKLDPATLEKILKMMPLTDAEKAQIKAMNK